MTVFAAVFMMEFNIGFHELLMLLVIGFLVFVVPLAGLIVLVYAVLRFFRRDDQP